MENRFVVLVIILTLLPSTALVALGEESNPTDKKNPTSYDMQACQSKLNETLTSEIQMRSLVFRLQEELASLRQKKSTDSSDHNQTGDKQENGK